MVEAKPSEHDSMKVYILDVKSPNLYRSIEDGEHILKRNGLGR